jgi:serine/threonine protein kinase/tetratricopeptide (TPR) repeat protein
MKSTAFELTGDDLSGSSPMQRVLADVLDEYLQRLERGEAPSTAELVAAHPELAEQLPEYLEGVRQVHEALAAAGDGPPRPIVAAEHRRQIGEFELVHEIGRGGMGVVYEARQLSLNRRVALKVLPFAAVLDERQISRFRTEAQAAAALHHPNIVPVFAVGQERGVHFYAMQYIEGSSLAHAIQELRGEFSGEESAAAHDATTVVLSAVGEHSTLGTIHETNYFRTVADVGAQAAEALHHAHQYGVVHRDIKPSNLLLDADGKLWVTDFGLARVQSEMSVTLPGDIVGTLRYMSPEQAQGRGDLVDGRTDVYSLGATLYEMVTLRPAHPGGDQRALMRWIATEPPVSPRRLNHSVPADLETIILRAMEKCRDDRYLTAQELADDLRRYLDGRPTLARRPSLVDRGAKWVSRRRGVALAVGAAMLLVTLVSLVSAFWIAAAGQRTALALAESQANLARADAHYRQARAVVDHFGGDLSDRLAVLPGAESLRRELLEDTLGYYRQFLSTVGEDALLQGELAATHFKSAAIAERLGDLHSARKSYRLAVECWRSLSARSAEQQQRSALAVGIAHLARVEGALGQFDSAEHMFNEAIPIQRELFRASQQDARMAGALAESLANRGQMLRRAGRDQQAIEDIREAARLLGLAVQYAPDDAGHARDFAVVNNNLSDVLRESSPQEAMAACRAAEQILRDLAQRFPDDDVYQADLAMTCNNLAALYGSAGEWDRAADGYQKSVEQIAPLVAQNPHIPRYRRELAITQSNLSLAYARLRRQAESDAAFRSAAEILKSLAEDFPEQAAY